jgi:hypothetical protein
MNLSRSSFVKPFDGGSNEVEIALLLRGSFTIPFGASPDAIKL